MVPKVCYIHFSLSGGFSVTLMTNMFMFAYVSSTLKKDFPKCEYSDTSRIIFTVHCNALECRKGKPQFPKLVRQAKEEERTLFCLETGFKFTHQICMFSIPFFFFFNNMVWVGPWTHSAAKSLITGSEWEKAHHLPNTNKRFICTSHSSNTCILHSKRYWTYLAIFSKKKKMFCRKWICSLLYFSC